MVFALAQLELPQGTRGNPGERKAHLAAAPTKPELNKSYPRERVETPPQGPRAASNKLT